MPRSPATSSARALRDGRASRLVSIRSECRGTAVTRSVPSQFAGQAGDDPYDDPYPEETTEPVDAAPPHGEAEDEDRAANVVCGATDHGAESPPREGEEQRRVRELR